MFLRSASVLFGLATVLAAQSPGWQFGILGRDPQLFEQTEVHALALYDPDRAGPAGPHVVVAGGSSVESNPLYPGVALYDPATGNWRELAEGVDGVVRAVRVGPTGDLFAAGDFVEAGGAPASRIARWDGERWHALGLGLDEQTGSGVRAFVVTGKGTVHVAGAFEVAGAVTASGVASYAGGRWAALGLGVEGAVRTASLLTTGDLAVAGTFEFAGNSYCSNVARWDGQVWHPLGLGIEGMVHAALALPNGGLVVGGRFEFAGAQRVANVARWNGKEWLAMAPGIDCTVTGLARLQGSGLAASTATCGVFRWDGEVWHEVAGAATPGGLDGYLHTLLAAPDGKLFAGGEGLYCWGGSEWETLLEREVY
ncbi:MAG: hypothetical protein NXI31_01285 [bacterium]|nr:hypothetical protein [bacterium]